LCQTRAGAPLARDAGILFSKMYEIPRAIAARVRCASSLPLNSTVQLLAMGSQQLYLWLNYCQIEGTKLYTAVFNVILTVYVLKTQKRASTVNISEIQCNYIFGIFRAKIIKLEKLSPFLLFSN
jgi:hypothetical protein